MAHFEKYTQQAARAILGHNHRTRKSERENIDPADTPRNYYMTDCNPFVALNEKISMSKKSGGRVNSRTVALVSCIITLPQNFEGDHILFFESCKEYLDSLFTRENCISAVVHFDEPNAQPHLHYCFTPIKEKGEGVQQFNAKQLLTLPFLQRFHGDLDKYLAGVFGRSVGILNGHTKRGNLTVPQLKEQAKLVRDAREVLKKGKAKIEQNEQTNKALETERDILESEVIDLRREVRQLKKEKAELEAQKAREREAYLEHCRHVADEVLR